ncbi:MAG: hypothetical protein NZ602_05650 [Thermoguttaceae bacterium]|nr:hypothetical protein [Thermoguttaceae bacterium]MDW8037931.1 hypothetical protein [Thermoguttaceae bacterium]
MWFVVWRGVSGQKMGLRACLKRGFGPLGSQVFPLPGWATTEALGTLATQSFTGRWNEDGLHPFSDNLEQLLHWQGQTSSHPPQGSFLGKYSEECRMAKRGNIAKKGSETKHFLIFRVIFQGAISSKEQLGSFEKFVIPLFGAIISRNLE